MSTTENTAVDGVMSHQALKKGELRVLATEYEQRTIKMLSELESGAISDLRRRLVGTQLGNRFEFLGRLQRMDVTTSSNDWLALHAAWLEVQGGA